MSESRPELWVPWKPATCAHSMMNQVHLGQVLIGRSRGSSCTSPQRFIYKDWGVLCAEHMLGIVRILFCILCIRNRLLTKKVRKQNNNKHVLLCWG